MSHGAGVTSSSPPNPCLDSLPFTACLQLRAGAGHPSLFSASVSRTLLGVTAEPEVIQKEGRGLRMHTVCCARDWGRDEEPMLAMEGGRQGDQGSVINIVEADHIGHSVAPSFLDSHSSAQFPRLVVKQFPSGPIKYPESQAPFALSRSEAWPGN